MATDTRKRRRNGTGFVNLTNDDFTAGQDAKRARSSTPTIPKPDSQVYTDHLHTSAQQASDIARLYDTRASLTDAVFDGDDSGQNAAIAMLAGLLLDQNSRDALANKWHAVYSVKSTANRARTTNRVLYQCACGYDHSAKKASAQRKSALPFTGCLAHVEVTYSADDRHVFRIRGYTEHNEPCRTAVFVRIPRLPLHPSVIEEAVKHRMLGCSTSDLYDRNRALLERRSYPEQPAVKDLPNSPFRWVLEQTDMRTIYRKESLQRGLDVRTQAQYNVDEWLDPACPKYRPEFAEALFHYQARAEHGERFEACVATKEMNEAAWSYVHEQQLILDGTFGVCDRKVLLFIAMGVDSNKKGVPVAFFFFSAPTGNQQTSAGYDTAILTKLIAKWRASLEAQRPGCKFTPSTAITDTDLRERAALVAVWTGILLLICKFHLRQAWRNYRNRSLKGKSPTMIELKTRMRNFEKGLVESTSILEANLLLQAEREYVANLTDSSAGKKGTAYLDYIESYWMKDDLWRSWSKYARVRASQILHCDVDDVIPTTNHLESFNGILKRTHLRRFQHGQKRLRLDLLLLLLVTDIVPNLFKRRRLLALQYNGLDAQIARLPGGQALLAARDALADKKKAILAYVEPDQRREDAARELIAQHRLFDLRNEPMHVSARCYSSRATQDSQVSYDIVVRFNSTASCSCDDFQGRGGACKHLRAVLLAIDMYRSGASGYAPVAIPPTPLPMSERAARLLALERAGTDLANEASSSPVAGESVQLLERIPDAMPDFMEDGGSDGTQSDTNDVDDLDSVKTDASSSSDEEDTLTAHAPADSHRARASLHAQTLARVARQLKEWTPRVGDVTEWLQNVADFSQSTDDERRVVELARSKYGALIDELDRWMGGSERQRSPTAAAQNDSRAQPRATPSSSPSSPTPTPACRPTRPAVSTTTASRRLMCASPELSQRRKQSYGTD